ncbi:MAG: DUF4396 domain-containing protein [Pseudomonadota bacterium]
MQQQKQCHSTTGHTSVMPHTGGHTLHAHHEHTSGSKTTLATHVTLHCLLGCAIGELAGLMIGVTLGFEPWATIVLATALGFASGYLFGLWPLVRKGKSWGEAFRLIWLGETISIAVMELVMNVVDYNLGGVHASSVISLQFWVGYLFALPAGFIAAWPVNYWLLSRDIKQPCH